MTAWGTLKCSIACFFQQYVIEIVEQMAEKCHFEYAVVTKPYLYQLYSPSTVFPLLFISQAIPVRVKISLSGKERNSIKPLN